eukprot:TRINITY_DN5404_c0_g1_i1.p1 TRINITY_DN5404_c0_g1~~TRINITY_DN5404_c0_g1_i1.p1  ORF type:complete len:1978 (-),score=607.76 TRINITY_DN5404_c0_g1_i1:41-5974(-)
MDQKQNAKKGSGGGMGNSSMDNFIPLGKGRSRTTKPASSSSSSLATGGSNSNNNNSNQNESNPSSSSTSSSSSQQLKEEEKKNGAKKERKVMEEMEELIEEYLREGNKYLLMNMIQRFLFLSKVTTELEQQYLLSILYLAKRIPSFFTDLEPLQLLISFIRECVSLPNTKKNNSSVIAIINALLISFRNSRDWPIEFIKLYAEDALGERMWIDDDLARDFVKNVLTAFPGRDSKSFSKASNNNNGVKNEMQEGEEHEAEEEWLGVSGLPNLYIETKNRYSEKSQELIKMEILPLLKNANSSSPNFLKLLSVFVAYEEIRLTVAERMEEWLNNATLSRAAKVLLQALIYYCTSTNDEDVQCLCLILKMKPKSLSSQVHADLIMQLLRNNNDYAPIALRLLIQIEMLPTKTNTNMKLIISIYKSIPVDPEEQIAFVFQELVATEAYSPNSKSVLKKIIKAISPNEFNFVVFARGIMKERGELRSVFAANIIDFLCTLQILSVPIQLVSTEISLFQAEQLKTLYSFRKNISIIQSEIMKWFQMDVAKQLTCNGGNLSITSYNAYLKKVLMMEASGSYFGGESINDLERNNIWKMFQIIPVLEETITRIILIALNNWLPSNEALDILETLLKRSCAIHSQLFSIQPDLLGDQRIVGMFKQPIVVENTQVIEALMRLSIYRPPNATDQLLVQFPSFCVSQWYWQSVSLLMIIGAFSPSTIGKAISLIPTTQSLLQMIVTRTWKFPPSISVSERNEEQQILSKEISLQLHEKNQVLLLENILSQKNSPNLDSRIDETSSLLISQLMVFDPLGPCRQPPPSLVTKLQQFDQDYKLGHLYCSSRSPDFLLSIMSKLDDDILSEGSNNETHWLTHIIEQEPITLSVLPLACLVRVLVHIANHFDSLFVHQSVQITNFISIISKILFQNDKNSYEILESFLSGLENRKSGIRDVHKKAIYLLLQSHSSKLSIESVSVKKQWLDCQWLNTLHNLLGNSGKWEQYSEIICKKLGEAIQLETHLSSLSSYIQFMSHHSINENQSIQLAINLCKLIRNRDIILNELVLLENVSVTMMDIIHKALNILQKGNFRLETLVSKEEMIWVERKGESVERYQSSKLIWFSSVQLLIKIQKHLSSSSLIEKQNQFLVSLMGRNHPKIVSLENYPLKFTKDFDQLVQFMNGSSEMNRIAIDSCSTEQLISILLSDSLRLESCSKLLERLDNESSTPSIIKERFELIKEQVQIYQLLGVTAGNKFYQRHFSAVGGEEKGMEIDENTSDVVENTSHIQQSNANLESEYNRINDDLYHQGKDKRSMGDISFSPPPGNLDLNIYSYMISTWLLFSQKESAKKDQIMNEMKRMKVPFFYGIDLRESQDLKAISFKKLLSDQHPNWAQLLRRMKAFPNEIQEEQFWEECMDLLVKKECPIMQKVIECLVEEQLQNQKSNDLQRQNIQMQNKLMQLSKMNESYEGLFLDWLFMIVDQFSSSSSLDFIFNSNCSPSYIPLLFGNLLHSASWKTLHRCCNSILEKSEMPNSISLTFVIAYLFHPKSWMGLNYEEEKGNVNRILFGNRRENRDLGPILHTSPQFVFQLLSWMTTDQSADEEKLRKILESVQGPIINVVELLLGNLKADSSKSKDIYRKFLLIIYLNSSLDLRRRIEESFDKLESLSVLLQQEILSKSTKFFSLHSEWKALVRLSQLYPKSIVIDSRIISLASGLTNEKLVELIDNQQFWVFKYLSEIMEAIRSSSLQETYMEYFHSIIRFLKKIKTHDEVLSSTIEICLWMTYHFLLSVSPIQFSSMASGPSFSTFQFTTMLENISNLYPELRKLLQEIHFHQQQRAITQNLSSLTFHQSIHIRNNLDLNNNDHSISSISGCLSDLDQGSQLSPSILSPFIQQLLSLTQSQKPEMRSQSYQLLLRNAQTCPSNHDIMVDGLLLNLVHQDERIRIDAISRMSHFYSILKVPKFLQKILDTPSISQQVAQQMISSFTKRG